MKDKDDWSCEGTTVGRRASIGSNATILPVRVGVVAEGLHQVAVEPVADLRVIEQSGRCRAFERRLKYDERLKPQTCPECGREDARFRISAPALVGGGTDSQAEMGVCPNSGAPCGCANAVRH